MTDGGSDRIEPPEGDLGEAPLRRRRVQPQAAGAARELAAAKAAERQTEEIERLERFVGRFRYGTKARQANQGPTPLEEVEARIEGQERRIAALEAELAEDWADANKIAAHRRARDELQGLLARWEELVDEVAS